MKCLDCGNEEIFVEAQISWDKVYYQIGTDDVMDAKNIGVDDYDAPRECGNCDSTNVKPSEDPYA